MLLRFELGDNSISFKVDGVPYRTVDIQHHEDVRSSIWSTSLQEFVSDARLHSGIRGPLTCDAPWEASTSLS